MELTKKDKRHIEEEIRNLQIRINVEASEYAQLYKRTYLEGLKSKIDTELEIMQFVNDKSIEMANNNNSLF